MLLLTCTEKCLATTALSAAQASASRLEQLQSEEGDESEAVAEAPVHHPSQP